jgi:Mg-chelatase subunit ChlD
MLHNSTNTIQPGLRRPRRAKRKGAIIYLVAFLILALMACVAFSIDVAYMQLTRTQLRVSTDLATRAAAEALERTNDLPTARAAAKSIALSNKVAGAGLVLGDSDIVFGKATKNSTTGVATFATSTTACDAVRIVGNRTTGSTNGNVQLFFGKLFNNSAFQPSMAATVVTPGFTKRDMVLVIDRSGSMDEWSGSGSMTKWQALETAVDYFFDAVNTTEDVEKVGLATYSSQGKMDLKVTTKYSDVTHKIDSYGPNGSTNITDGIDEGINAFVGTRAATDDEVEKVMVVMTDGLHNVGTGPTSKISEVNSNNIRLITITFGADADQTTMTTLAEACNGRHYHAPTGDQLVNIFTQIGLGLDGLQYAE